MKRRLKLCWPLHTEVMKVWILFIENSACFVSSKHKWTVMTVCLPSRQSSTLVRLICKWPLSKVLQYSSFNTSGYTEKARSGRKDLTTLLIPLKTKTGLEIVFRDTNSPKGSINLYTLHTKPSSFNRTAEPLLSMALRLPLHKLKTVWLFARSSSHDGRKREMSQRRSMCRVYMDPSHLSQKQLFIIHKVK